MVKNRQKYANKIKVWPLRFTISLMKTPENQLKQSLTNLLFPFLIISSDWGHAKDFVEAMWHMLQLEKPEDFVIATGHMHSVREFVEKSFAFIGKEIVWEGKGKLSAVKCFYLKSTQY